MNISKRSSHKNRRIGSGDVKKNTARDVAIYLARVLTNENERNLSVYFGNIVDAGILCGISK
jgi:chromosomal replication initiation ATPase DnaA